jgi:hypothetical protein
MKIIQIFAFLFICLAMKTVKGQDEISVLFIGNSLTFSNDMPKMLQNISVANGKKIIVDTVVKRGMSIKYHSSQQKTFNRIKSRKWSYVVIQGFSTEFAQPKGIVDSTTIPYLRIIVDSIRFYNKCSKIILYETWGYKLGKTEIPNAVDYSQMQDLIKQQTVRAADIFSIGVCPVGEAWKKVQKSDQNMELYTADNYHPTKTGSYIAACTFYTTLFAESAYGNKSTININPANRKTIETISATVLIGNRTKWSLTFPVKFPMTGFDLILQNNELKLVDKSLHSKSVDWYFGDGVSSKDNSPKHVYKKKGTYTINQVVHGKCGSNNLKRTISVKAVDL